MYVLYPTYLRAPGRALRLQSYLPTYIRSKQAHTLVACLNRARSIIIHPARPEIGSGPFSTYSYLGRYTCFLSSSRYACARRGADGRKERTHSRNVSRVPAQLHA